MRGSDRVERYLSEEFFRRADVGFAVFDRQLRYCALNPYLADINGIPVSSHLGKTIRDVLGALSDQVTPGVRDVLESGDPVQREVVGSLPGQSRLGRWAVNYFGLRNEDGASSLVGVVVVELAKDIRVQGCAIAPSPILRSWKEIAHYFGSCVKTVQRWERLYDFPVRRLQASKGAAVFAIKSEVERWQMEATIKRSRTLGTRQAKNSRHL
jgi:PAS domain-containing protein